LSAGPRRLLGTAGLLGRLRPLLGWLDSLWRCRLPLRRRRRPAALPGRPLLLPGLGAGGWGPRRLLVGWVRVPTRGRP
jgi:hypothetical protein